jgi:hypothetical protein
VDGRDYGKTPATVRDLHTAASGPPHPGRVWPQDRRVVLSSSRPSQSVNVACERRHRRHPERRGGASAAGGRRRPAAAGALAGRLAADWREGVPRWQMVGTTPLMVPSGGGCMTPCLELTDIGPGPRPSAWSRPRAIGSRRLWRDSVGARGLGLWPPAASP